MSLERDVMGFLQDLLSDLIGEPNKAITFFTPHDKIREQQLPFSQVFNPIASSELGTFGQRVTTLSMEAETILTFDMAGDSRNIIETFASMIRRDPTLGGLVLRTTVDLRGLDERTQTTELSRSGVAISVEYDDGDIRVEAGDPQAITTLVDLVGNADKITPAAAGNTVVDSTLIPGAVAFDYNAGSIFPIWAIDQVLGGFPEFPIDFTPHPRFRVLTYIEPALAGILLQTRVALATGTGFTDWNSWIHAGGSRNGWQEHLVNTADTPLQSVGSVDLSNIDQIFIQYFASGFFPSAGVHLKRIFHYPRDLGSHEYSPGF